MVVVKHDGREKKWSEIKEFVMYQPDSIEKREINCQIAPFKFDFSRKDKHVVE